MAVTASHKTVHDLERLGSFGSPLFNIFGNLFLGLFDREETKKMITELFSRGGRILDPKEISFLADLSGGNPFLIQLIGYYHYEDGKGKKKVVLSEFENKMLDQLRSHFENYCEHLTEDEIDFLMNPTGMNCPIGHKLIRKGFLIEENGKWKNFSPLFERFLNIKNEKTSHGKYPLIMSISALLITIAVSLSMFVDSTIIILTILFLALLIPAFYLLKRWLR